MFVPNFVYCDAIFIVNDLIIPNVDRIGDIVSQYSHIQRWIYPQRLAGDRQPRHSKNSADRTCSGVPSMAFQRRRPLMRWSST